MTRLESLEAERDAARRDAEEARQRTRDVEAALRRTQAELVRLDEALSKDAWVLPEWSQAVLRRLTNDWMDCRREEWSAYGDPADEEDYEPGQAFRCYPRWGPTGESQCASTERYLSMHPDTCPIKRLALMLEPENAERWAREKEAVLQQRAAEARSQTPEGQAEAGEARLLADAFMQARAQAVPDNVAKLWGDLPKDGDGG